MFRATDAAEAQVGATEAVEPRASASRASSISSRANSGLERQLEAAPEHASVNG